MQKINTEEVFWERVDIKGADDCWEWKAKRYPYGYGAFKYKGKQCGAHRYAYAFANGVPEESLGVVRHTCDNPPCCNPRHLVNGTYADNNQDMIAKGRGVTVHGELHGMCKLNEKQVRDIIDREAMGEKQRVLAAEYGVSPPYISSIARKKYWKHIGAAVTSVAAESK